MPNLETQEQVDKTIQALKDYQNARRLEEKAKTFTLDKLTALKNATGISGNSGPQIEEEVLRMLGHIQVHGVPDKR